MMIFGALGEAALVPTAQQAELAFIALVQERAGQWGNAKTVSTRWFRSEMAEELFLVLPGCSYVPGQVPVIDGGWAAR